METEEKHLKKRNKNKLPVLDSDEDLLAAFEKKNKIKSDPSAQTSADSLKNNPVNKHGINMLAGSRDREKKKEDEIEENFADLLEEFYQQRRSGPVHKPSPMPVKKRLKRYPPVELELDLHGFNTIGAQIKARSFIHTCKHQGYFTVRIIVGKGVHSDLGPVLPDVIEDELKEMKKQDLVIGYAWDKKKKSKSGSVIVYLKQFEQYE